MLNLSFWRPSTAKQPAQPYPADHETVLSQIKPGKIVKVVGLDKLPTAQRQHLQAYGLMPGRYIQVLAQRPVTIVLVEQTELAFETEIAAQVMTQ